MTKRRKPRKRKNLIKTLREGNRAPYGSRKHRKATKALWDWLRS